MNILIGGAWPYANGSLHIGHIAALVPGDVLARYFRAKGDTVFFVSGSDCHGTPVAIRAKQENKTPQEVSDYYHEEFSECFDKLGFSYDVYGKTSSEETSLLLGRTDVKLKLPDEIISSEYLTLEGRKISTSGNWAIWAKDIVDRYNPDSIRYFLIANGPERRDTDFTWREFINSHNGELLGAYGNFVNRSLVFIQKAFGGKVPDGQGNKAIVSTLISLYPCIGLLIEQGKFKEALDSIFAFVRQANKYFDEEQPWLTVKSDTEKCGETLNTCVQIIANLSILLEPFLPFSSQKVRDILSIENVSWEYIEIQAGLELGPVEILFERIDKKVIDEEEAKLKG